MKKFCKPALNKLLTLALLFSACTALGQTQAPRPPVAPNSKLPTDETVNDFLKHMFGWNQDLTWKIADIRPSEDPEIAEVTAIFNTPQGQQVFRIFVTPDQKFAITGDMVPFGADPFATARSELRAANGPAHGPADAPVTIVEFGDLECPACKAAQPHVKELLEEEPKVRLIFQNFPIESIHKWSLVGAKYLTCVAQQGNDKAFSFISTVYEHQGEITPDTADAMLKGYAKEVGANPETVAACITKPETEAQVRESVKFGEKMNVNSTPTFFINGRKVVGLGNSTPYEVIKAIVDYNLTPAK